MTLLMYYDYLRFALALAIALHSERQAFDGRICIMAWAIGNAQDASNSFDLYI